MTDQREPQAARPTADDARPGEQPDPTEVRQPGESDGAAPAASARGDDGAGPLDERTQEMPAADRPEPLAGDAGTDAGRNPATDAGVVSDTGTDTDRTPSTDTDPAGDAGMEASRNPSTDAPSDAVGDAGTDADRNPSTDPNPNIDAVGDAETSPRDPSAHAGTDAETAVLRDSSTDTADAETTVLRDRPSDSATDRDVDDDATAIREPADPETQLLTREDDAKPTDPPTRVLGAEDPAAPMGGSTAMGGSTLYRDEDDTVTNDPVPEPAVTDPEPESDPEAERAAARAATRAERNRALGKVSRPEPEPAPTVIPAVVPTTDKWHGSLALFALRLVLGGIFFIRGIQHLTALTDTQNFIDQNTILPYPEILGWVLAIGEILIAVALIFGLLVRVAGFGALVIGVLALVLVLWGVSNPFQPNMPGFIGELELLIAAVGFAFLLLGGGRWGIDGMFRKRRRLKKAAAGR